jgi:hypothetical protein
MLQRMYGYFMIKKQDAIKIKKLSLEAIVNLSQILKEFEGNSKGNDFQVIKRGVGLSIGRIQTELLEFVYSKFPELDDLT